MEQLHRFVPNDHVTATDPEFSEEQIRLLLDELRDHIDTITQKESQVLQEVARVAGQR